MYLDISRKIQMIIHVYLPTYWKKCRVNKIDLPRQLKKGRVDKINLPNNL